MLISNRLLHVYFQSPVSWLNGPVDGELPVHHHLISWLFTAVATWFCLMATHVIAQPPQALVGVFSGASQNSAFYSASSDPKDVNFTGSASDKSGSTVWREELQRFQPGLSISTGSRVKAGVGFVSHWWTQAGGLTADGLAVKNDLINRMKSNTLADGFVCHALASAAYNESTSTLFRTELAGYATALKQAVDDEFGTGNRKFTFWWMDPGNRWNNAEGGPNAAADRRRQPLDLAGKRDHVPASEPLPFFRVAPTVMTYVIGDWNTSGDGIHLTRASNQRAGRQLAYSMLTDWGADDGPIQRELSIEFAWRDPSDTKALVVKVLTNGGTLIAGRQPLRISTATGAGVSTDNQGLLNGDWTISVDNSTAAQGFSLVRLVRKTDLPTEDLFFSHTWGIWHTITPGRPSNNYTGPLVVWHEDLTGTTGMTQNFADLTGTQRSIIMTLGSEHLIPITTYVPEPISLGTLGVILAGSLLHRGPRSCASVTSCELIKR